VTAAQPDAPGWRRPVVVDGYLRRASDAATASGDRREVLGWIDRRGWRLAQFHEDVSPARSGLREAIGRVQSRETGGVVAIGLTHLGRTLEEALTAVERIHAAGGLFVSVHDGLDLSTAAGRRRHRRLLTTLEPHSEKLPAPVDDHRLAGDHGAGLGGEEDGGADDVLRLQAALDRPA
jgi:Resolvase, N terminal domain